MKSGFLAGIFKPIITTVSLKIFDEVGVLIEYQNKTKKQNKTKNCVTEENNFVGLHISMDVCSI